MQLEIIECDKCRKISIGNYCQFCYSAINRQLATRSRLDND